MQASVEMSGVEARKAFSERLTEFERCEILRLRKPVFFVSKRSAKNQKSSASSGFCDSAGFYLVKPHDHIAYRYEILEELGRGAFGVVVKVPSFYPPSLSPTGPACFPRSSTTKAGLCSLSSW